MTFVCINVAFVFNYYEINPSDTKNITFKVCFKRFDLTKKNSNYYKIQIVMSTSN